METFISVRRVIQHLLFKISKNYLKKNSNMWKTKLTLKLQLDIQECTCTPKIEMWCDIFIYQQHCIVFFANLVWEWRKFLSSNLRRILEEILLINKRFFVGNFFFAKISFTIFLNEILNWVFWFCLTLLKNQSKFS